MEYNEKQTAIINTAEKLFAEKGFDGTSVRDIAQEAGINIAMISYYFGSKEKLMEALFENRTTATRLKIEALIQDAEMPHIEKVNTLIDGYVDKFMQRQAFHKIMIREQLVDNGSIISGCIFDVKKRNLDSIKKLIQDGQKAGVFKKNIDVMLMMTTMVGTVNQMLASQRFYRQMNNMEDMPEAEFQKHIKKKLSTHLKHLFKITLANG
jgi:AcrR family transcriptional regulator